jgi:UDP-N-acetylmuramoyl-tripeptide--D-alanyl-D-alanine ligase
LKKNPVQISELYQIYRKHPSIQTDTRKLKPGDFFFALKGPHYNGNHFALSAIENGAAYAVIDEAPITPHPRLITVEDVLITLQELAKYHREQLSIPVLAITGSNGKTTSKELISAVLSQRYITYTTQGNLNNHIGVPLTLLSIRSDAEMAVIEMGANHQKEIASYCRYTEPTHGLITNCGKAHLEGFGGVEGVRKGKGELYDYLRNNKGTAFIYDDYDYFHEMSKGIEKIVWYGQQKGTVQGHVLESEPFLDVKITVGTEQIGLIKTQLVGDYNLPNVLAAITIGKYFSVPEEKIKTALENYTPTNSRSQLIKKDSNSIILDAYNANPTSMRAAIENFAKLHASKKVLMLGGMMELGDESIAEHEQILQLIRQHTWEKVVLVGGDFATTHGDFLFFSDSKKARDWFQQQHFTDTHFLIKGSRSMQMEKILS